MLKRNKAKKKVLRLTTLVIKTWTTTALLLFSAQLLVTHSSSDLFIPLNPSIELWECEASQFIGIYGQGFLEEVDQKEISNVTALDAVKKDPTRQIP